MQCLFLTASPYIPACRNALFLCFFLCPLLSFGQRQKWTNQVSVSTSFSHYADYAPYDLPLTGTNSTVLDLDLEFVTADSGTFTVEGEELIRRRTYETIELPSPTVSVGGSVQIMNGNGLFHEISLTRLSFFDFTQFSQIERLDSFNNVLYTFPESIEHRMFTAGARYELGKYFGERRRQVPNLRFGLSAGLETTYFHYRRRYYNIFDPPVIANLLAVELSVIPVFSLQATKELLIDLKFVPNMLIADFGQVKIERGTVPDRQNISTRDYNPPDLNWVIGLHLRYVIQASERR